jgi:hypothetical protein
MGTPVRILNQMHSSVLMGRRVLLLKKVVLDLRAGHGPFLSAVVTHMGCIVTWNVEDSAAEHGALVSEDLKAAVEGMDLSELGDGTKYQEALRNVLLKYVDAFAPTTETVQGVEYSIQLKPDADLSQFNRPSSRNYPKELAMERQAMNNLLERGIVQPSASCYGANDVFV